jgi:hypothetical protein
LWSFGTSVPLGGIFSGTGFGTTAAGAFVGFVDGAAADEPVPFVSALGTGLAGGFARGFEDAFGEGFTDGLATGFAATGGFFGAGFGAD